MLSEALSALAATGGTALVTAMVTDGWETVRSRFARLLGRGDPEQAKAQEERLERSKTQLEPLSGPDRERAGAEQAIAWRARFEDLLEEDPAAAEPLRALITEVQAQPTLNIGRIEQHATAHDQSQQAVQAAGVQNVTFGDQR